MGLFSFLSGGRNPAKDAMPYLNQIPGVGKQYYNPFIEQGRQASEQLSPLYNQMTNNPSDYLNQLMGKYEPSAGYQYRQGQLNKAAGNTAAQGGFAGTENDVMGRSELINKLMGGDMQEFLQNVLGIQGAGMQGLQGREERGYNASANLADYLGGNLGQQAGLAFQGTAQKNQNQNALFGQLMQAMGVGAGSYFGNKARPRGMTGTGDGMSGYDNLRSAQSSYGGSARMGATSGLFG
jgi:hypothetical protein